MTLTRAFAIAGVAVAAAVAGTALASGQTATQSTTLTFTAKPAGGSGLDVGRKGPSIGDEFFEHGKLTGSSSGRYQLVTQLIAGNARRGTEHNALSLTLPGGRLESEGGHGTVSRFSMPVVGGTGAYEGARGVLSIAPGGHGSERVTVTLDR